VRVGADVALRVAGELTGPSHIPGLSSRPGLSDSLISHRSPNAHNGRIGRPAPAPSRRLRCRRLSVLHEGEECLQRRPVYYSFIVLTTTGFGDFTPARPFGHALAVLEMLTGQLYLVTVIGIVVGNFAGRRTARDVQAQRSRPDLEVT
jgi:hypothetical protein